MKVVVVMPGQASSIHFTELPKPSAHEIPQWPKHGYKLVVGTVNANRECFEAGVYDFARTGLEFPCRLPKLLTHSVIGRENNQVMLSTLTTERSAIKVYTKVAYD
jgi:hypothetical protein